MKERWIDKLFNKIATFPTLVKGILLFLFLIGLGVIYNGMF